MTDLIERLQQAASAAISNERPSLENGVGRVVGLTIELAIRSDGQVAEATAFVERRTAGSALLVRRAAS